MTGQEVNGFDAEDFKRITAWLEGDLGGKVVHIERQARWRPAWWVDLERGGDILPLCVRGDRLDSASAFSLEHERTFQTLLSDGGIKVAKVYGWSDEPKAYVMDRVPGRDNFDGVPDDERQRVMEDYVDVLLAMHQLDPDQFSDAGIVRAERPEESHLVGLGRFEAQAYRHEKKRPDPFLEFALAWLARNRPENPGREAPIVWDAGQFHHHEGRIAAMLDLEFGHVGDPLSDLAALWVRNPFIPFGDVSALLRRYQERAGTPIDMDAVQWHYILWALSNQLEFHSVLADPVPGADYMLNMHWCVETNLMALEGIAKEIGVTLGEVEEPRPMMSAYGPAHRHLARALDELPSVDRVERYRMRMSVRLARHLERIDEIGPQVVAADLDDTRRLIGSTVRTWEDGEAELEQFVLADDGAHDAELVAVFHRRLHRARMLNGPSGSWITQHRRIEQPSLMAGSS
jgi:aminoglycoside phosphotransferase (APT) family kinase protein